MTMTEYSGLPTEAFRFLTDLSLNNSKDWFEANRDIYDIHWKQAGLDLIEALAPGMARLDPPLKAEARLNGSLRRIYRDVRFSKDKTPYSASMHLIFWSGEHPNRSAGMHINLRPDGVGFGAGLYGIEPTQLAEFRARIVDAADRRVLLDAVETARSVGCEFGEPALKRMPKGFSGDAEWEHLLRRKAFVMRTDGQQAAPDWLFTPQAPGYLLRITEALMPLIKWLA
ncbi:MAG: DUF2461 domain-containing protein [Marinosulfonomonas sp.]|nr:DUF2461 domain-containing protein [Marinosulfonomonas sp.]